MEYVVLVDEENQVVGTADKSVVHSDKTPLHRAFSIFIFDNQGRLLLQKRSKYKKAWPLTWSNSCCGHPMLNESNCEAAIRRCEYELNIKVKNVTEALPYRYTFIHQNVMENEICPILIGSFDGSVEANFKEVDDIQWIAWSEWLVLIKKTPEHYSPWCVEESLLLETHFSINLPF